MNYTYKITCNHPSKFTGYIYYGKHQHKTPHRNKYMGGGQVLEAVQNTLGLQYFTKEVLSIYKSNAEACEDEKRLVDKCFVSQERNFNVAIGGGSRNCHSAHPWKIRVLEDLNDADEANSRGISLPQYREEISKKIKQLYHDNGVSVL